MIIPLNSKIKAILDHIQISINPLPVNNLPFLSLRKTITSAKPIKYIDVAIAFPTPNNNPTVPPNDVSNES